jgi:hypothetical protein
MMTQSEKDCPMSFANEPKYHAKASPPRPGEWAGATPPRRSWWRRWGVKLMLTIVPCIALLAANFAYRHYRAVAGVEAAVAALDRDEPGWRLHEIEAARPVIPDDENSALVVSRAFALLPPRWPPTELSERFADQQPQARLRDEDTAWLSDELCQRQDALVEARKMADLPKGRHPITYKRDFISTLLPTQQNARALMNLLQFDGMLQVQEGDLKGALRSCRALLNTARSIGDEPLLISQLVRMAGVSIACQAVQRVLAQGQPESEDLLEVQKLLEDEAKFRRLLVGARGERGGAHECLDALECGDITSSDIAGTRPSWSGRLIDAVARDRIREQHPGLLAMESEIVRIADMPAHKRAEAMAVLEAKVQNEPEGSVIRLLMPAMTKIDAAARRTDGNLRCLIAAVAAERYRNRHGHLPENLEQLVPDFLAEVPLDPHDGEPLRFHRLEDRVVIYSLREGPSHAGALAPYDPDEPSPPGVGVAVHLFKVEHRRQPPLPPKPAPQPGKQGGPHPGVAS